MSANSRPTALALVILAALLAFGTTASAAPITKCNAAKKKCLGKYIAAVMGCHAQAEGRGLPVDPVCLAKAAAKITGNGKGCFDKNDIKDDGCSDTGDASAQLVKADAFVLDVVQELDPGYPVPVLNKCSAGKKKCVGKKASGLMGCEAKGNSSTGVDPACAAKMVDRFMGCFPKSEDTPPCLTTGDVAAIEAKIDAWVADAVSDLDIPPPTPTPTRTPTPTPTATINLCNNGVIDGTEACDGTELAGATCVSLGFASGTLACTTICHYDVSNCVESACDETVTGVNTTVIPSPGATPPAFENLKVELGSTKVDYAIGDACIPVSLVLTNTGTQNISLSFVQADEIASNLKVGLYNPATREFESDFTHTAGAEIRPLNQGPFLVPGQSSTLSTTISRERVTLYSVPPPSGGIVRRNLNLQGPFGSTVPGLLGVGRIDITVDIDFGDLPGSRTFDPGADVDFVAGEVLVGFNAGVTLDEVEPIVAVNGCHIYHTYLFSNKRLAVLSIPFDRTTGEVIDAFLTDPRVEFAERNYLFSFP